METYKPIRMDSIVGSVFSDEEGIDKIGVIVDPCDGFYRLDLTDVSYLSKHYLRFNSPICGSTVPLNVRFKAANIDALHPVGSVNFYGNRGTAVFFGRPCFVDEIVFSVSLDDLTPITQTFH